MNKSTKVQSPVRFVLVALMVAWSSLGIVMILHDGWWWAWLLAMGAWIGWQGLRTGVSVDVDQLRLRRIGPAIEIERDAVVRFEPMVTRNFGMCLRWGLRVVTVDREYEFDYLQAFTRPGRESERLSQQVVQLNSWLSSRR